MKRTSFIAQTEVGGVAQLDLLQNNIDRFDLRYEPVYYLVDSTDISRPDIISYKHYGSVYYWWIICAVNQIQNPLVDLVVGDILKIPNLIDIYEFAKKCKIK